VATTRDDVRFFIESAKLCAVDAVWIVLFFAVMGGLWWVAYKIEPHYASKDGLRFLCNAQEINEGQPAGRPRETRVLVMGDGALHCTQKRMMRRSGSLWTLIGKSDEPPKRLQVYLAQELDDGHALPGLLALRIPDKSRVIAVLDRILEERELRRSRPNQGTSESADPPDRD
jgi:hypothetical protein